MEFEMAKRIGEIGCGISGNVSQFSVRDTQGEGLLSSTITHIGFADKSHWNTGRFRSLGLVTTRIDQVEILNKDLGRIFADSGIKEFKWKELDGAKERFAAEKCCEFAIAKACDGVLRIDVLIWDIDDERHKVRFRDDVANLQRMYYHLFRNVLRARWPSDAVWELHPDEFTGMDWEQIEDFLEDRSVTIEVEHSIFTRGAFRLRLRREFRIEKISPVSSCACPLLQLADLFAGLAVFSHEKFDEYRAYLQTKSPQKRLFDEDDLSKDPSRSSRERFIVLERFDEMCKAKKMGVSLEKKRGLWTPKPQNPVNFWLYEPQHPDDKAPTRK